MSKRILVALGAVVLLLALASSAVFAEGPGDRPAPKVSHNPLLGIVPTHGEAASRLRTNGGNLTYHNGPVMHTNTTYAIYWILAGFSVSTNYESLINGFFQNVSADNGKTSNVYYSDTQYYSIPLQKLSRPRRLCGLQNERRELFLATVEGSRHQTRAVLGHAV